MLIEHFNRQLVYETPIKNKLSPLEMKLEPCTLRGGLNKKTCFHEMEQPSLHVKKMLVIPWLANNAKMQLHAKNFDSKEDV